MKLRAILTTTILASLVYSPTIKSINTTSPHLEQSIAKLELIPQTDEPSGFIQLPLRGTVTITSDYGPRIDPVKKRKGKIHNRPHKGIDMISNQWEIYPMTPGILCYSFNKGGYGKQMINIPNSPEDLGYFYAHLKEATRSFWEGTQKPSFFDLDTIIQGDASCKMITIQDQNTPVAIMGATGHSTGQHLHLMLRRINNQENNGPIFEEYNPTPIIDSLYHSKE